MARFADEPGGDPRFAVLPGVLSRKKQIMPTLEAAARSPKVEAPPAKAAHVAEGARVPVAA